MVKGGTEEIDMLTVGKVGLEIDRRARIYPPPPPPPQPPCCFQWTTLSNKPKNASPCGSERVCIRDRIATVCMHP